MCSFIVKLKVVSFTVCNRKQRSSLQQAKGLRAVKENARIKETLNTAAIHPATPSSANPGRPSSLLPREAGQRFALT